MKTHIIVKTEWSEADIQAGLYIIKNSSSVGSSDLSFACTVVWKIGFAAEKKGYNLISVLTDGMVFYVGDKKEMADKLNSDNFGYRPIKKDEYLRLLESTNQGFLDY